MLLNQEIVIVINHDEDFSNFQVEAEYTKSPVEIQLPKPHYRVLIFFIILCNYIFSNFNLLYCLFLINQQLLTSFFDTEEISAKHEKMGKN